MLDCEDEDGDDASAVVLDCEDEDGDDAERAVLDCEDEDGDDGARFSIAKTKTATTALPCWIATTTTTGDE